MNTKSFVAYALVGALAFVPLVGCGAQSTDDVASGTISTDEESVTDELAPEDEQLAGGWTVSTESTATLSKEEQEVFAKASEGYDGADLEPVAVLATQLVAGTNYAYLCKATTVTADPVTKWAVAVVYNNLEGDATITSVKDVDLANIEATDETENTSELMGAWEILAVDEDATLPEDAANAFKKAQEGFVGMDLKPIALLGTQVVAGTNYLVLCEGAPVTENPTEFLYVTKVYEDLDGNAEFSEVQALDFLAYV